MGISEWENVISSPWQVDSWIILIRRVVVRQQLAKMKYCCQKCFVDFLLLALFFNLAKLILILIWTYIYVALVIPMQLNTSTIRRYGFIGKKKRKYPTRVRYPYAMHALVLRFLDFFFLPSKVVNFLFLSKTSLLLCSGLFIKLSRTVNLAVHYRDPQWKVSIWPVTIQNKNIWLQWKVLFFQESFVHKLLYR